MLSLKDYLDEKVDRFNRIDFIENDPISIPHAFSLKQDIEIMGFFAAMLAWGQRITIINKCKELSERMDGAPFDFVQNHQENDLKKLLNFKHRTFNDTDLLYFISFFKHHFSNHTSLEEAFIINQQKENFAVEKSLNNFRSYFFSLTDYPKRTIKHVTSPSQKSTCKRLNMFLRWMVRKDDRKVDFGIWENIAAKHLICPCDLHVDRQARKLGLITRKQTDWQTAIELTENLRLLNPNDPVIYDFALFGMGIDEKRLNQLI